MVANQNTISGHHLTDSAHSGHHLDTCPQTKLTSNTSNTSTNTSTDNLQEPIKTPSLATTYQT